MCDTSAFGQPLWTCVGSLSVTNALVANISMTSVELFSFEKNMLNILEICEEECAYLVWNKYKLSETLCSLWSEIFHTGETFIEFVFKCKQIHCSCYETTKSTEVHWQRSSMKLRRRAVPKMWTDKSHAPHLPRLHLHATVAEILEGRLDAGRNRRKWPLMTCAQTEHVFF